MKRYWIEIKRIERVEYGFSVEAENEEQAKLKGIEEGKTICSDIDYEVDLIGIPEVINIIEIKKTQSLKQER